MPLSQISTVTQRLDALQALPVGQEVAVHLQTPSAPSQVSPCAQVTPLHLPVPEQAPLTQLSPTGHEVELHWQVATQWALVHTGVVPVQTVPEQGSVATQCWATQHLGSGQELTEHLHCPSAVSQDSPAAQVTPWHLPCGMHEPLEQRSPVGHEVVLHWHTATPPTMTQTGVVPVQDFLEQRSSTQRCEAPQI